MKKHKNTLFAVSIALLFSSCAKNPVTGNREIMLMSESQEIALGQQSDPQIVAQFGLYENAALQRFISEKGQQMAAISHRDNLNYEFKIVDSPVINAFAVPGGYVYFTRGILAHFNNEAQFAGVLGHEIGHITARHSAQQQSKAQLAQFGLVLGSVVSPQVARLGNELSQGVGLLFLKFGRDDERESDRLGVEYSTKIGYDAEEMGDFFLTLQRAQGGGEEGNAVPGFLSTHPNPGERFETVNQLAAEWQQKLNQPNLKVNRESYLRMIDGIIYGEDPKQGFVENNTFYHPELKFKFPIPAQWMHQNSPQQFQMASQDGNAMMALTLVPGESLEAAAQQLLQQYQLQQVEAQKTTVNGLPAIAMVADQQQQGGVIRTLTYLIQYGGNIYSLMGISSAANFNNYMQAFTSTMQSFSQLTEPDKLNRQPERIRIKTVAQSTTLAQALRNFNTPENRLEELAILNGLQLNDRVEKGMLIKTVAQ
ncbi:M48 family metalloprotease [Pontibacter harenae]|uniref:M48 family metalloprotease n=1 Tax=Pontibacter harenae TaxID=2894083 RepID=UPI001E48DFAE|nr:M48 family metalloprotease [Pontibacter harenae]MCC9166623.1 M48 family metalloprotease [Pontibacter harenae]